MTAQILKFRPKQPDLVRLHDVAISEAMALHKASVRLLEEAVRVQYALWYLLLDPPTLPPKS